MLVKSEHIFFFTQQFKNFEMFVEDITSHYEFLFPIVDLLSVDPEKYYLTRYKV